MSVDIRVRGYHLDVYQHVNNGRYLEFLEEARWEYMSVTGFGKALADLGMAMVIVNINVNYRKPALLNDLLRVSVTVSHIGSKSARLDQVVSRINDDGSVDLIVDATVTFCVMDQKTEKAVLLEGALHDLLAFGMEK